MKDSGFQINYGIKTGCNEAFIIDSECRNDILNNCFDENERKRTDELIRPILRGKDISRYHYSYENLYVILAYYGSYKILESNYPAIYKYLSQYKNVLENRGQCRYTSSHKINTNGDYPGQHHWLELDNNPSIKKMEEFSKPKIIYREISTSMDAVLIEDEMYINNKAYFITGNHLEYLLCYLNSNLFNNIILKKANNTGGKGPDYLLNQKLYIPSKEKEEELVTLYRKMMLTKDQTLRASFDKSINKFFYKLYELNNEEVYFLENHI